MDSKTDFMPSQAPSISSCREDEDYDRARREGECSPNGYEDEFSNLDYWFGSISFRSMLAQDVFDRVTPGCSFVTADSLLSSQQHNFPFQHALDLCKERGFSNPFSDISTRQGQHGAALMVLIGHVARTRSQDGVRDLLRLLRGSIDSTQVVQSYGSAAIDEKNSTGPNTDAVREQMPLAMPKHENDNFKYTSMLKEKGDEVGFVPVYNFKHVSTTPPLFKAVVSFQDYVFEGSGRSKPHAKHAASREASNALGLVE